MTREDLERWERQQMSQQTAGNIFRFNRVYGGSPLAGQRQFLFADVFANWRMGRADPYWRTTYAMMGGGIVLLYGMLAMWFFVGTFQLRVLSAALLVVVTIWLMGKARGDVGSGHAVREAHRAALRIWKLNDERSAEMSSRCELLVPSPCEGHRAWLTALPPCATLVVSIGPI
jgi:hypothetical protein